MLIHVAPARLRRCCCNIGTYEEIISDEGDDFTQMEKDVEAVEILMTKIKVGKEDIEHDQDEQPFTVRSLGLNSFRMARKRMSFFEGHRLYRKKGKKKKKKGQKKGRPKNCPSKKKGQTQKK